MSFIDLSPLNSLALPHLLDLVWWIYQSVVEDSGFLSLLIVCEIQAEMGKSVGYFLISLLF